MRNGTQDELDAAKDDATYLPRGAKFKTVDSGNPNVDPEMPFGVEVYRGCPDGGYDYAGDHDAVAFTNGVDYWYVAACDLEPIHD